MSDPTRADERLRAWVDTARAGGAGLHEPPARGFEDVERRLRRRRRGRLVRGAAGVALVLLAGALLLPSLSRPERGERLAAPDRAATPTHPRVAPGPPPRVAEGFRGVRIERGVVAAAAEGCDWERIGPAEVAVHAGVLCLAIAPRVAPAPPVRVSLWDARVVVVGTELCVTAEATRTSRVAVLEGTVRVDWSNGTATIVSAGLETDGPGGASRPLPADRRAVLAAGLAVATGVLDADPPPSFAPLRAVGEGPRPSDGPPLAGPPEEESPAAHATARTASRPPTGRVPEARPPLSVGAAARRMPDACAEARGDAERALGAEEYERSVDALRRVIEACSDALDVEVAYLDLGRVLRARPGRAGPAIQVYERYLSRFPAGRFREDAIAALCRAAAADGRAEVARTWAAAYLATYPDGGYVGELSALAGAAAPPEAAP